MEMFLFGSEPINVTRETLQAMPPHQRSECIALMRERGQSETTIGKTLDIGFHIVRRLLDAKHQYVIPPAAEERIAPVAIPAAVLEKIDISRNGLRLLRRIGVERGGWKAGKALISRETGLYDRALEKAVSEVLDRGLVVRLGYSGRGPAPTYTITPQGSTLLAQAAETVPAEA